MTAALFRDDEKRTFSRVPVSLPGKIFANAGLSEDCATIDLSCSGAAVRCSGSPPSGAALLFIEKIGRVPVKLVRQTGDTLGLRFDCNDRKRWELGLAVAQYMTDGVIQITRLRRQERLSVLNMYVTLPTGEHFRCDALDVSGTGIALKTDRRPPVGQFVQVKSTLGRVARHLPEGIVVEFVQAAPSSIVQFPLTPDGGSPDLAG